MLNYQRPEKRIGSEEMWISRGNTEGILKRKR
jgi:hypothetical protein